MKQVMGRNKQPTVTKGSSHTTPDPGADRLMPDDVASYVSHIRALIVAGNLRMASKSLNGFRVRFGEKWVDLPEIREIETQIMRMKALTGK